MSSIMTCARQTGAQRTTRASTAHRTVVSTTRAMALLAAWPGELYHRAGRQVASGHAGGRQPMIVNRSVRPQKKSFRNRTCGADPGSAPRLEQPLNPSLQVGSRSRPTPGLYQNRVALSTKTAVFVRHPGILVTSLQAMTYNGADDSWRIIGRFRERLRDRSRSAPWKAVDVRRRPADIALRHR
jgi:hypothetical protein